MKIVELKDSSEMANLKDYNDDDWLHFLDSDTWYCRYADWWCQRKLKEDQIKDLRLKDSLNKMTH